MLVHHQFDPDAETLNLSPEPSQSRTSGLRALIRIEIDESLTKLRDFDEAVNRRINFPSESPIAIAQRSDALRSEPLPSFNRSYWDRTPTPNIGDALTSNEIEGVHNFYSQIDQLTRLKSEKEKYPRRSEWRRAFERVLRPLLESGNPLG